MEDLREDKKEVILLGEKREIEFGIEKETFKGNVPKKIKKFIPARA
ncbi:MAG: hypothetical protein MOIL_01453 [Candidatus Methanolliviera sp. GoM_oil]|nr:MAG: hypothetical protein MOIL_01453 [Candidatus Methanolliviera sp. GoM_oil]